SGPKARDDRRKGTKSPSALPQSVAEFAREDFDGAARAAGELQLPLALGFETAVAQALAPGLDRLANRIEIEGIAPQVAGARHHVRRDADERAERRTRLDRILSAHPRLWERGRQRLHVIEEEALGAVADFREPRATAQLLHCRQEVDDL